MAIKDDGSKLPSSYSSPDKGVEALNYLLTMPYFYRRYSSDISLNLNGSPNSFSQASVI